MRLVVGELLVVRAAVHGVTDVGQRQSRAGLAQGPAQHERVAVVLGVVVGNDRVGCHLRRSLRRQPDICRVVGRSVAVSSSSGPMKLFMVSIRFANAELGPAPGPVRGRQPGLVLGRGGRAVLHAVRRVSGDRAAGGRDGGDARHPRPARGPAHRGGDHAGEPRRDDLRSGRGRRERAGGGARRARRPPARRVLPVGGRDADAARGGRLSPRAPRRRAHPRRGRARGHRAAIARRRVRPGAAVRVPGRAASARAAGRRAALGHAAGGPDGRGPARRPSAGVQARADPGRSARPAVGPDLGGEPVRAARRPLLPGRRLRAVRRLRVRRLRHRPGPGGRRSGGGAHPAPGSHPGASRDRRPGARAGEPDAPGHRGDDGRGRASPRPPRR